MASIAEIQLRNAESSILFMQQEHAKTLQGLHSEIQNLQKNCADLTFQLAMQSAGDADADNDETLGKENSIMAKELRQKESQCHDLEKELEKKSLKIKMMEQQMKAQEKKFLDELRQKNQKMTSLEHEIQQKSDNIAYMTQKLRQLNLRQHGSEVGGHEGARHSPTPPRAPRPDYSRSGRFRKSAASPVPSQGACRPPQRPSSRGVPDPTPFLVSSEPLDPSDVEVKAGPSVLPPIMAPGGATAPHYHKNAIRRHISHFAKKPRSEVRSSQVVELAVDPVGSNTDADCRQIEQTNSD